MAHPMAGEMHSMHTAKMKSMGVEPEYGGGTEREAYAKGGHVKKGGTTVNVIVAGGGGGAPKPAAPPMPMPIPGPPPGAGPMPPPGPPGGMPMRKRGGRVARADGGSVAGAGQIKKPQWSKDMDAQIATGANGVMKPTGSAASANASVNDMLNRKNGGRVYPKMEDGAGGGGGRREKITAYGKNAGPVIGNKT